MTAESQKPPLDPESRFVEDTEAVDTVFIENPGRQSSFRFDDTVALAFDDMARRSIPLYGETQRLSARLVEQYSRPGTRVYDLGCSTGTSLLFAASRLSDPAIEIIGVDNSEPMLARCRERLKGHGYTGRVELVHGDIADVPIETASVVLMHYTLQFLPVSRRLPLLKRIREAIVPGGVLLISEKAVHGDSTIDAILTGLYYDFKKRNGYSELEIARKREALENVLVPLSVDDTQEMLSQAGFAAVRLLSKCFQFCSFIAYT